MGYARKMHDSIVSCHHVPNRGEIQDIHLKVSDVISVRRLEIEDIDRMRLAKFINDIASHKAASACNKDVH
jgi:hypothetical protein